MIVLVDHDCVFRVIMIYNVILHCECIHETIYYVMGKMFWNVLEFSWWRVPRRINLLLLVIMIIGHCKVSICMCINWMHVSMYCCILCCICGMFSSLDFLMSTFWREGIKGRVLEGGDTTSWDSNQETSLQALSRTKTRRRNSPTWAWALGLGETLSWECCGIWS